MKKQENKIKLQGHEKFTLRDGWLNKGLLLIENNPSIFSSKEAPDIFGIGNNMVKSLRYWLKAYGLLDSTGTDLTETGKIIKKYDIFFEDIFTIWVLHSNIVKNVSEATTWHMYFNKCVSEELSKEQIIAILSREIKKYTNNQKFSEQSLKNDVDVLLNMYSKEKEIVDPEDKNISPFVQLGLIKNSENYYSKNHPEVRKINEWMIILYEVIHMLQKRKSISIDGALKREKLYDLVPDTYY